MPQVETEHPVLEAIAEFRDLVNRLIDAQISALSQHSAQPEIDPQRAVVHEPTLAATPPSAAVSDHPPHPTPEPISRKPLPAAIKPKPAPPLPTERPREAAPEPTSQAAEETSPPPEQRDSRQRLDALARLLDKRAKQTGTTPAPAVTRPKETP